jgi:hypothetical protein
MIPKEIYRILEENRIFLSERSKEIVQKLSSLEIELENFNSKVPEKIELGYLHTYDPAKLALLSDQKPFEFAIFNTFENLYFNSLLQIKQLLGAYEAALSQGNYYTSVVLLRSWIEVIAFSYYPLFCAQKKIPEVINVVKSLVKTKSESEKKRLTIEYAKLSHAIFSKGLDSFNSRSPDFLENLSKQIDYSIEGGQEAKRVHINDTIRELEKESKFPIESLYSLLSDFSHPNTGSRMLMMETLENSNGIMSKAVLRSTGISKEATLFYFDVFSESILHIFNLTLTYPHRYGDFLDYWYSILESSPSKH